MESAQLKIENLQTTNLISTIGCIEIRITLLEGKIDHISISKVGCGEVILKSLIELESLSKIAAYADHAYHKEMDRRAAIVASILESHPTDNQ